ncbi:MAG: 2-dehydropantoate 2-reductase [Hellea sp.]|nr:2-dehydropantoate 2-reductase [Hellea sp.]
MGSIQNLKVAVFGAGSIGCYLGGYLLSAGCQVVLYGREKIKWEIDLKGLVLTHYKRKPIQIPQGQIDFRLKYDDLEMADIILVCVKSQDCEEAADLLRHKAGPGALLVSCQNGVRNAQTLEAVTGRRALGAIVPFNVTSIRRGEFHSGTEGDLMIEQDPDERLSTMVKAFRKSGMGVKTTPHIRDYQWGKLLINLNNALSALSGDTLRAGLSQKPYRQVLASMIEEGLNVCRGAGINPQTFGKVSISKTIKILRLPDLLFQVVMNRIMKIDENARSSMLDDLEAGKKSEVDFLQGEIVGLARATGQYAPINSVILAEVQQAFRIHQSPKMSGSELLALLGPHNDPDPESDYEPDQEPEN